MKAARQRREIAPTPRVKTRATDPSYRRISLGLPFEAEVHLRVACQPQLTLSLGSVSEAWRATRRLAEGEGFEPPVPFRVQWFSRPVMGGRSNSSSQFTPVKSALSAHDLRADWGLSAP